MAYVASMSAVNAGAANTSIPSFVDVGQSGAGRRNLYSHMRVDGAGALNVGFDGGPTRAALGTAGGSMVIAIPITALVVNTNAACVLSFGVDT